MSNLHFQNIKGVIKLTSKEKQFIKLLPDDITGIWSGDIEGIKSKSNREIKNATKRRDDLKKKIMSELLKIQTYHCIYCGISLKIVEGPDREHIAPKDKHPEFTFHEKNFALACALCNRFSKKNNKETIAKKKSEYSKCKFYLVHPHFNNYSYFFKFKQNSDGTRLQIKPKRNSAKAKWNISTFELDGLEQEEQRMGALIINARKAKISEEEAINLIRKNKYTP